MSVVLEFWLFGQSEFMLFSKRTLSAVVAGLTKDNTHSSEIARKMSGSWLRNKVSTETVKF